MGSLSKDAEEHEPGASRPPMIAPPDDLAATAIAPDYAVLYEHAEREGPQFWAAIAHELQWETNPRETIVGAGPSARWFGDGAGNLTTNCLDRHLHESRRDKPALIWHGARGEERRFTYAELHRFVCKFASGLKELGVGAGMIVALALPPSPEGLAALLACARLGAIASPLIGIETEAARSRLRAAQPGLVITTADVLASEGAEASPLARILDAQAEGPRVIVWRRTVGGAHGGQGQIDLADLLKGASPRCEPLIVPAAAPFFALPGEAGAGRAEGPRFAHGGFAVGVAFTTRIAYDLKDETIYCPLGPGDWLAERPALILGPLLNGATIVLHETPPPTALLAALDSDRVTTVVAPTALLRDLAAAGGQAGTIADQHLRLVIGDGPPLPVGDWWTLYRDILRERAHLCANWWEPALGASVIGTLPSMAARPGWLGEPFPGIDAAIAEGQNTDGGKGEHLRLGGAWPHLAHGVDLATIAPPARRDEAGYITLAATD